MNFTKFVSAAITAGTLFGAAHAGAQVIDETLSGYVTAVETVWTQRIVHEPVTTTSCHTTSSYADAQGNLGNMVIGGLVGSAIGNKLSSLPVTEVALEPPVQELESALEKELQMAREADEQREKDAKAQSQKSADPPGVNDEEAEVPAVDSEGQASLF